MAKFLAYVYSRLLLFFALVILIPINTWAEDKPVTIAFGMDKEPFLFPKGSGQGLEIDIVKSALKVKGYQVKVKQLPQLALRTALEDDVSLSAAAGSYKGSHSGIYFSDIYINYENYVITRKEDALKINSLADLKGKKIAIWSDGHNQLGDGFYALFNPSGRMNHTPDFYEINNQKNQLNMFFNRDVEVVVIDKTVFGWYKSMVAPVLFSDADFVFHDLLPQVTGYNLVFRDRSLRDAFNDGLKQLMQSGRYQQLIDYYLSSKGVTISRQLSRSKGKHNNLSLNTDEKRWLRLNPIVMFTGDPNFLPFEGFDDEGVYTGMVADHLTLLEQKLGVYFSKVVPTSWSHALEIAKDKKVDVISGGIANTVLYDDYTPVASFISNPVVVVKTKDDDFVNSLDDIRNDSIAIVHNASFNQEVKNRYPNHRFIDIGTIREGLEGVSNGKYNAMISTMAPANYQIGEMGLYNLRIVGKTELDIELTLFVSNEKPVLHGILTKLLQRISAAEHQQINSRWIKQRYVEKTDYSVIAQVVGVAFVIIIVFLYWNRRLREEVRLRIATEAALKIAKERAESATQAKSAFLSNMSHEIRTPMNAIMGFTELLGENVKDKQQQSFIKTIQTAGHNLLTLINDILDLSKIEAGKLDIHLVATNPHQLFDEVAKLFMVELDKKQLVLNFDVDSNIPKSLLLDTARLRQILFNLIGNAVKFTDKGGIELVARQQLNARQQNRLNLLISVEDTGVGIADEDLAEVFGTFEQAKAQDNQKYGGTGLGLAISLRLARLMNGDIKVSSALGEGTRFDLSLNDVEISSHIVDEHEMEKAAEQVSVNFQPATVLVVDDVEINRLLVKECLALTSLTILDADSGVAALELLNDHKVDLILMDIRMPGMDGYEAAEKAKKITDVPIVALTATVMDPLDQSFIDSPFDGYLKKPVFKKELFLSLKNYLSHEANASKEAKPIKAAKIRLSKLAKTDAQLILNILTEELLPQWQGIRASNRVGDIKRFAETIDGLGQKYNIIACRDYALSLNETLDAYDIVGIKNSVKNFPVLSGMIKKQLEKALK